MKRHSAVIVMDSCMEYTQALNKFIKKQLTPDEFIIVLGDLVGSIEYLIETCKIDKIEIKTNAGVKLMNLRKDNK